ncbi:hypothetical protein FALCPG4_003136 [Fusarium falciforme]
MRDKARGNMAAPAAGSRLMVATYGIREWECILLGFGPDNVREIAVDGRSRRVARTSPRLRWQLAMDENNRQGAATNLLLLLLLLTIQLEHRTKDRRQVKLQPRPINRRHARLRDVFNMRVIRFALVSGS